MPERPGAAVTPAAPRHRPVRPSLSEQLAKELLDEIVAGVFLPGDPLPTELQLAERAGVSRLTVREAIGWLRQKSVIEIRRGRGTFVLPREAWSPLDPSVLEARAGHGDGLTSMEYLLEARRLVEVGVAELAAARRDEEDLHRLEAALSRMRQAGQDVDAFVEGDLAFHDALMRAAGNPVIAALFTPVRDLLEQSRRATSKRSPDREGAIAAHGDILEAVSRKDPGLARAAMSDHLTQTESSARRNRPSVSAGRRAPTADGRGAGRRATPARPRRAAGRRDPDAP